MLSGARVRPRAGSVDAYDPRSTDWKQADGNL